MSLKVCTCLAGVRVTSYGALKVWQTAQGGGAHHQTSEEESGHIEGTPNEENQKTERRRGRKASKAVWRMSQWQRHGAASYETQI